MLKDAKARIIRKETWGGYHLLGIKTPKIANLAQPGQFLMVRVNDQPYPLLRRPFSIHAREGDTVEIFFARAGAGTAILAEKKEGDSLDILGPLGKGFAIEGNLKGKTVYLVGGGRGIAPLYFLAQELRAKRAIPMIFYGGKAKADLPLWRKLKAQKIDMLVSTDDGSFGFHGFVSELLENVLAQAGRSSRLAKLSRSSQTTRWPQAHIPAQIFACGPEPMMKAIAALADARNIPAQYSVESIMGCGIGACWGCVKRIRRGDKTEWVKICEEGPVFRGPEIVWERED